MDDITFTFNRSHEYCGVGFSFVSHLVDVPNGEADVVHEEKSP